MARRRHDILRADAEKPAFTVERAVGVAMTDSGRGDPGGRLVLHGGLVSGLGYALRIGARLLAFLFAAWLFGATLFGAFVIAIAILDAAVIAAGLSTKWVLFKWLDENRAAGDRPDSHVLLDAALLVLGASLLLSVLIAAGAIALPDFEPQTRMALLALLATLPLQALTDLALTATRWTEVMRYELVAKSVIQPLLSIVLALVAYSVGWRELGLPLAFVAGTAAGLAYALVGVERRFGGLRLAAYRPNPATLLSRLRSAAHTTGADLTDALYNRVDIYVVGFLLGAHAAGVYGLARQMSLPVRQAKQSFDSMLIPLVSRTVARFGPGPAAGCIATASRFVLLVQLPVVILLAALGFPLLRLAGDDFIAGFGALLLLALAETVQGAFALGELLLVYNRPRTAMALTLVSLALGAAGAVLLAPWYGLSGIAAAVLASYAVRGLLRRFVLGRAFAMRVPFRLWAAPVAAGTAGLAAAFLASRAVSGAGEPTAAAAAALAGLAAYALAVAAWLTLSGATLLPEGFAAAPERDPAAAG